MLYRTAERRGRAQRFARGPPAAQDKAGSGAAGGSVADMADDRGVPQVSTVRHRCRCRAASFPFAGPGFGAGRTRE